MIKEDCGVGRGSEWHKVDLHLHSPKTWLNNEYKNVSEDDFVKAVVDSGVKAVGLTNYFRFADGELFGDDSIKRKLEKHGITVFPNLELRLSYQNKRNELCDYHILFSPNVTQEEFNTMISKIEVHGGNNIKKPATLLSVDELKNSKDLYVHHDQLCRALADEHVCNKVVFGFMSRGKGESRSATASDEICNKSDFIIHSSDSKKNIEGDYEFWVSQSPSKAIFQGSDAHALKDVCSKYTWIKCNLNLDGLREVTLSPRNRVDPHIGSPLSGKLDSLTIDRIEYGNASIGINPELNSIIGRRGEGKSILLEAVAASVNKELVINKLGRQKYGSDQQYIERAFPNLKIKWKSGSDDAHRGILYIPQGYIGRLAYDGGDGDERNKFVRDIFSGNKDFVRTERVLSILSAESGRIIDKKIDALKLAASDKLSLEQSNEDYGDLDSIKKKVADLDEAIKKLGQSVSIEGDELSKYNKLICKRSTLSTGVECDSRDIAILKNMASDNVTVDIVGVDCGGLSDEVYGQLIDKLVGRDGENVQRQISALIDKLQRRVAKNNKAIGELDKQIAPIKIRLDASKELLAISKQRNTLVDKSKMIADNQKRIAELIRKEDEAIDAMVGQYMSHYARMVKIYSSIQLDKFEYIDVKIVPSDRVDVNGIVDDCLNRRQVSSISEASKKLIESGCMYVDRTAMLDVIRDIFDDKFAFKHGISDKYEVMRRLLRCPNKTDYINSICQKSTGASFSNMTGGQRAMAILELIFKLNTGGYPILIDQPEDDLDATGISNSVIGFIERHKRERQIIIASHSSNLVVNADSDAVIVAKKTGESFTYETGAMEDGATRKSIIDIMEGGREALVLRRRKLFL